MYERILNERINQQLYNEEKNNPIPTNTEEFKEIQFHFNTIFNDISQKTNNPDQKIYEIDKAFSLKNKYISLNFEKREMNEVTSYGWYSSESSDDKKFDDLVFKLKTKGLEKIENEINVSPPLPSSDVEIHDIYLCKFIIGESLIIFKGDDESELIDDYLEKYDTIVYISNDKTKRYKILKLENIQLLYLIKIKEGGFEQQIISCSDSNCKSNEAGSDSLPVQNKNNIYYCSLYENYLCQNCHIKYHQTQVHFGNIDINKCEIKTFLNLPGECYNPFVHQKNEVIDFFCQDCNKGICSFCRFYGNEKHPKLDIISNLFGNCRPIEKENKTFLEINTQFNKITNDLNSKISDTQRSNQLMANKLRDVVINEFKDMFKEVDDKFTEEGEKLLRICYQLNFVKDMILTYHKLYCEKETILKNNKLRQEVFWTKRVHLEHMLYLIANKEKIDTEYVVRDDEFDEIINEHIKNIDGYIQDAMGVFERLSVENDKPKNSPLTIDNLIKEARIDMNINKSSSNN